jgi:hypothetical protein
LKELLKRIAFGTLWIHNPEREAGEEVESEAWLEQRGYPQFTNPEISQGIRTKR